MEISPPLHLCHVSKTSIFINRLHGLLHSIAIAFLIYYRASFLFQEPQTKATVPMLLWLLVFVAELLLSFIWLIGQAYGWHPVSRTVFPERLPEDDKLPAIDVFICTVDPDKEPTLEVMNTVLSAMVLDYPAEKLNLYLSDDGGAAVTLHGMKEAWRFAKSWLPFCKKYGIKTRCPKAYFSATSKDDDSFGSSNEFMADRQIIQEKYEDFKERVMRFREDFVLEETKSDITGRDHPALVEVIQDNSNEEAPKDEANKMPLLVYVSREKRPSHPHHFKAGALNVLLRVSGVISNSPHILVLDCDMYCNDPTSARQAMCFFFDPNISSSLAFVQFPQRFHNISKHDIYDSQLRSTFGILWQGLDGLKGPVLSGTGFYIKRNSLYGDSMLKGCNLPELRDTFGLSNEFVNSIRQNYKAKPMSYGSVSSMLLHETRILASCDYPRHTKWGEEACDNF
ncbi:cellulose synthase-like protein E6 isoform X2 [Populus alba x Populus x berolinensis]|nr:cellulose synthase-like protein E6 isoform X2 [Populus alba x Populus x berolinensis]